MRHSRTSDNLQDPLGRLRRIAEPHVSHVLRHLNHLVRRRALIRFTDALCWQDQSIWHVGTVRAWFDDYDSDVKGRKITR